MKKVILKEHNLKAVEEIQEKYKAGIKDIIYVSGVGTGKTYVFLGLLDQYFTTGKILYVMPKYAIKENVENYEEFQFFEDRIDFVTYNYFNNYEKTKKKIGKYNFVLIDEVHHLGSDIFGRVLLKCMQEINVPFLGITATPIRDTDRVDVSSYFEARVNGLSNFDAIRLRLMPQILYRICLPEKNIAQLEREYDNEIRAVVDYTDSMEIVKDILKSYPRNKWICFFNNAKSIEQSIPMIRKIFSGYDVYVLHSRLKNLSEVLQGLKHSKKAVVLSCNMLLEGVHIDTVDGIILYRNCTSLGAFQQMIGRICKIGKKIDPVVIDCSSSGSKLLTKLIHENDQVGTVNIIKGTGRKEVVHVGLNAHESFDINEMLRLFGTRQDQKELKLKENAEIAVEKYYQFSNRKYRSMEELKKNNLDFQKMKSCAELYETTVEFMLLQMGA